MRAGDALGSLARDPIHHRPLLSVSRGGSSSGRGVPAGAAGRAGGA
jgi:hypothetical protein